MRVLYLTRSDAAGQGYLLTKAMRDELGWDAMNCVLSQTYLDYPIDWQPGVNVDMDEVAEYGKSADFIIFQETPPREVEGMEWLEGIAKTRNSCLHIVGSIARANKTGIAQAQSRIGIRVMNCIADPTIAPDLYCTSPFDPFMIDVERMKPIVSKTPRSNGITVCHATTAPKVKGTAWFSEIMAKNFPDVAFDIITGASWTECIRRKAKAHVLLDSISDRMYGISALEGTYMNQKVVSNISPWCYALRPTMPMLSFAPAMTGKSMEEGLIDAMKKALAGAVMSDDDETCLFWRSFAPEHVVQRWKHWINWVMKE